MDTIVQLSLEASGFNAYFPTKTILQVLFIGIVLGAGIPIIYAVGMKMYATSQESFYTTRRPAKIVLQSSAYILFALCAAIIIASIIYISVS